MYWFEKLKFARKITRLSVRDAAAQTDIPNCYLHQLENGKIANPSYFKMVKLLKLYNLDHEDINE